MNESHEPHHVSVLATPILAALSPQPGETWVDCTTGAGGHTRMLADAVGASGKVFALDQDAGMLALATPRLSGLPVSLIHANFDQLPEVLRNLGLTHVDGIFADLGFCSDQLDDPTRGLSFQHDGPLDMRLDPTASQTAADLVNRLSESALADLIFEFGEERHSRRIAKKLVARREETPFSTTADLADVVKHSVPWTADTKRIHPATRTFQALRIAVNDELAALDRLLAVAPRCLRIGGRFGVISFHSLEDRRVKQSLRDRPEWQVLTKKPIEADDTEARANPRARSAKFRAARRIEPPTH